jgi:PAS domain-containing protein
MRLLQNQEQELIYWNNALIKEVGQIKELLCSGIDITERTAFGRKLIRFEFHLLAESMPQIVWVNSRRTEYLFKSNGLITQDYL